MIRGLHLVRKFLRRAFVSSTLGLSTAVLTVIAPSWAWSAVYCADLFRDTHAVAAAFVFQNAPRVDSKFASSEQAAKFNEAIDRDVRESLRVWIEVKNASELLRSSFADELGSLQLRGLRSTELGGGTYVLNGTPDVMISALRHPSVIQVSKVEIGRPYRGRRPFFSRVAPRIHPARWVYDLPSKFEWPDFYKSVRARLLGKPGLQYQVLLQMKGLLRSSGEFGRFLLELRSLGLAVDLDAPKATSDMILVTGPIDLIYSVLRLPVVSKVIRFEDFFSEQQLLERQQAEFDFREKLKVDYLNIRDIPRGISLVGEPVIGKTIVGHRDREIPSLIRFEEVQNLRSVIEHEAQTARDYAKFVRRYFDQDFAFFAELNGKSVPIFDGLVLHRRTHVVQANVSLKYSSGKITEPRMEKLAEDVHSRFYEFRRKKKVLTEPDEWFRVINNLPADGLTRALPDYENNIRNAQMLSTLFGLFTPGDKGAREARIVVDIRHHGFSFEFFRDPMVQENLRELFVDRANRYHVSLMLLWNDRQGVEIRRNGVKLYE